MPPYPDTQEYVQRVLSLIQQSPPDALVDLARDRARAQREAEIRHKELLAKTQPPVGNKVYLTRDKNNQLVLTDTPPASPKAAKPSRPVTRRAAPAPGAS